MTAPFLAMITPLAGPSGPVDPGYGVPLPGVPDHPIMRPPVYPSHPIAGSPVYPSHPIYYPPGPVDPGYGVPIGGHPSHPIFTPPPVPTHPIYIPAPPTSPGAPPIAVQLPVFPWSPQHPIELPPEVNPTPPAGGGPIEWKAAWTPATGWIVVGIPTVPVPTPAK